MHYSAAKILSPLTTTPNRRLKKQKRCEFESCNDVSLFNETGIMYYDGGHYTQARQEFLTGLVRLNENNASTSIVTLFKEKESPLADCSHQDCDNDDYDNGMNVYTSALHINISASTEFQYATLFYNIAQTFRSVKQYDEAKNWFEKALKIIGNNGCGKYCAADGTGVSIVKVELCLAHCCYRLGENEEAAQYCHKVFVHVRELGFSKLDLAAAYNGLAVLHLADIHNHNNDNMGASQQKALELFHACLSIHRKILGDVTKEVATFLDNIGRVHYKRCEFQQARQLFEESLRIRRKLFAHDSVDLTSALLNLGRAYHSSGSLDEALKHYEEFVNLVGSKLKHKNMNRDLAIGFECIGKLCTDRGDFKNARCMFEKSLAYQRNDIFGEEEKYAKILAPILNNAGAVCYKMNDKAAALKYFEEQLVIEKKNTPMNQANIIVALQNIAQIHKDTGYYCEALCSYKEIYKLQIELQETSISHDDSDCGTGDEGEEESSSCGSVEIACTQTTIGFLYYLLENFTLSLEYYQIALEELCDHYGSKDSYEIALILDSIGLVFCKLQKHGLATEVFTESIEIRQKLGDISNRDLAALFHNVAACSWASGNEQEGIELYEKSLRLEEQVLGTDHPEISAALQYLGQVHQLSGQSDKAIQYFIKALEIERKTGCGNNNSASIFQLLNIIGNMHFMNADVCKMMECFVDASRLQTSCQDISQIGNSLVITGYHFYILSKLHPPCAAVA